MKPANIVMGGKV